MAEKTYSRDALEAILRAGGKTDEEIAEILDVVSENESVAARHTAIGNKCVDGTDVAEMDAFLVSIAEKISEVVIAKDCTPSSNNRNATTQHVIGVPTPIGFVRVQVFPDAD